MPTNLYGPGDNYHPEYSHVVAALIRRFYDAKLSGPRICRSGVPARRAAKSNMSTTHGGCLRAPDEGLLRCRNGQHRHRRGHLDRGVCARAAAVIGYTGTISYDISRPDGAARKLLDVSRLAALGWRARISLENGIALAYRAYLSESRQAAE